MTFLKSFIRKVLFFVCCLALASQLLFFTNSKSVLNAESNTVSEKNVNSEICDPCFSNDKTDYCILKSSRFHFTSDEIINVSFEIHSSYSINNYVELISGFRLISIKNTDNNEISVELECIPTCEEYKFSLQINLTSGNDLFANLYAVYNTYGVFISQLSEDDAYENFIQYALQKDIFDDTQGEAMRNERYSRGVVESSELNYNNDFTLCEDQIFATIVDENTPNTLNGVSLLANKNTYVKGRATWEDDNGNEHPLRKVMVKVYDEDNSESTNDLLGTVYTDNNGDYSLTFQNQDGFWDFENGGCDVFVRIYAGDNNVKVTNSSGTLYSYKSSVSNNVATGSTTIKNFVFKMTTDQGRAFQIGQAALTARDYAWEMRGIKPSDVSIHYPEGVGCAYYHDSKTIKITSTARQNTSVPESYASWDVIMHEYGHHISYDIGIINTISVGYEHGLQYSLSDTYGKEIGVALAWKESWPTVFGMAAQDYYSPYLSSIATLNDGNYDDYSFQSPLSIENLTDISFRYGEACSGSLVAVLWDIFDSNNEGNDSITLSHQDFWNVTTANQIKTFSGFIKNFYEMFPSKINALGANLSYYRISSTSPTLRHPTSISSTYTPQFSWVKQGGSTSWGNTVFFLSFYVSATDGTPYYTIGPIIDSSYTLTQEEWDEVRYLNGTIYVAIKAASMSNPITGEYISNYNSFSNPAPLNIQKSVTIASNSRYYENVSELKRGQAVDYSVTFSTAGRRMIQTFGTLDTYMYLLDSNGNQLELNDDSGYGLNALLNYIFEADVVYIIRVKFYNVNVSGKFKLAIIPSATGASSYNTIENFECMGSSNSYEGDLQQGKMNIFTITPTTDSYTIYTWYPTTKVDLYLYLIDPRSVELISTNSSAANVYNDDGNGDGQAKIQKDLKSGQPYILIVGAYNPSMSTGRYGFSIDRA